MVGDPQEVIFEKGSGGVYFNSLQTGPKLSWSSFLLVEFRTVLLGPSFT